MSTNRAMPMTARRLRFAVIGTGDFGPEFTNYIQEIADVVAVCDPNPAALERFTSRTGLDLPAYKDLSTLFSGERLDAVAVMSPNYTHSQICIAAARHGLNVYCEKAMALTVPECWAMVRACEEAGVRLMVGHKRRLRPPWARMIDLREQLGEVCAISSCLYHDARTYDFRGWWTRGSQCGGILHVAGVHTVDWMRAMCGAVKEVRASAGPQIDARYDFSDNLHFTLTFQSGAVATLAVSLSYPLLRFRESDGSLVVYRNGGVRFVPAQTHIDLYWQRFTDAKPIHERYDDLGFDHAFRKEIGDFCRWITDDVEPCFTWREGLRCVEVMEAAHRSAKQGGCSVPLPLYPQLEY